MGFTLFLLALLYAGFLAVLWQATGSGILLVLVGACLLLAQYFASDKLVLLGTRARLIGDQEEPELRRVVGRLAQMADLPSPQLAIIEAPMPNSFATGRSPRHAVVVVTRGLLSLLEPAELEAVLARDQPHQEPRHDGDNLCQPAGQRRLLHRPGRHVERLWHPGWAWPGQ
jgi:heat shock protein HtpX